MNPDAILEHSNFVRSLARSLVFDENTVDDITQKTLLTLIKKPPKGDHFPYGWLKTVVQNVDRMEKRTSIRRQKREEEVALPIAVRSTEEIVERQAVCQAVVDAVVNLEEPFLSIIVMRFYDDMSPRKIAKEMDVPVQKVKAWLQRGQEQLRQALDHKFHGNRKSWLLGLVPVAAGASLTTAAAGATASTASPLLLSGKALFSAKTAVLAGVLLVAAFLTLQSFFWNDETGGSGKNPSDGAAVGGSAMASADIPGDEASRSDQSTGYRERNGWEKIPDSRVPIPILVKNLLSGEPVKSYDIVVRRGDTLQGTPTRSVYTGQIENDDGSGSIPMNSSRPGRYVLEVSSSRHLASRVLFTFPLEKGDPGFTIFLDAGRELRGKLVDLDGRPVEGALIGIEGHTYLDRIERGLPGGGIECRTGKDGSFILQGVPAAPVTVVATHPLFPQSSITTMADDAFLEFKFKNGFRIHGKVLDDRGGPAAGVRIVIRGKETALDRTVTSGEDGSYRTPPLLPGSTVWIKAVAAGGERIGAGSEAAPRFTAECRKIESLDGDMEINFGPTEEHVTWRGTLFDRSRRGLPDGIILARPALGGASTFSAVSDEAGGFEIRKLLRGRKYMISLISRFHGFQTFVGEVKVPEEGSKIWRRDIHEHAGMIRGTVVYISTGETVSSGFVEASPVNVDAIAGIWQSRVDEAGVFCLRGLADGEYDLHYYGRPVDDRLTIDPSIRTEVNCRKIGRVVVGEGKVIDNIRLTIPLTSRAVLVGRRFQKGDTNLLKIRMIRIDMAAVRSPQPQVFPHQLGSDGSFSLPVQLEPGLWKAFISLSPSDPVERLFHVTRGKVSRLEFNRYDLTSGLGFTRVEGRVTLSDGSSFPGARINFRHVAAEGEHKEEGNLQCKTNSSGRFEVERLFPGKWEVILYWKNRAMRRGGFTHYYLDDCIIPENPPHQMAYKCVLPASRITATLYSDLNNRPLLEEDGTWTLLAREKSSDRRLLTMRNFLGSKLQITGLRAGEFYFEIMINGSVGYKSEPIPLVEGQHLDLGRIRLSRHR